MSASGIWQCADKGFIVGKIWRASPRLHDIHVVLSPFSNLKFFEVYALEQYACTSGLCSVCGLVLFSDYYSVIQKLLCNICSVQDLFRLFATEII